MTKYRDRELLVRIYRLALESRPVDKLSRLALQMAGRRIHTSGTRVKLDLTELR